MMRAWIAVALLASSWLLGLGYFSKGNAVAWLFTLAAAVLLLGNTPVRLPRMRQRIGILLLLLPTIWFVPFPYRGIVILLSLGIGTSLVPAPAPWLRRTTHGSLLAGMILLPQALVLWGYQIWTARAHELPAVCAESLAALARLLGAEATIDSAVLVLRNASTTIRVGATWELLLAPATACFLAGGSLLLILDNARRRTGLRSALHDLLTLLLLCAAWVPLRAILLATVVLQQRLRATPTTYPNVGETLISTWVHIVLLIGFALIVSLVIRRPAGNKKRVRTPRPDRPSTARQWCAAGACALGIATLAFLYFWAPVGKRKEGRVMVVERHSTWEPTTEPYGTTVYGEAGSYNYAAAYEYCSQYYHMSRLLPDDSIDGETLEGCDVLVIKTPTSRYTFEEVSAIVDFVNDGGSLLMIGDHTNVFNMNTYLNDISRHFGFTFRNDLLFRIGDPYRQMYYPPRIRHPILQYMPPMNFAVSCSIDPGSNRGRMVIRNVGLYNLPPAYHESNYHPQAEYRPYMQYGAWCQLWTTTHGKGRVAGFADSTLFSNFCTFQPGKSELLIGMLEWLNHRSTFDSLLIRRLLVYPLVLFGVALIVVAARLARGLRGGSLLLVAAGAMGWTVASGYVVQLHQTAMPLPPKHDPMPHVVIDRTISTVPLFTGAFPDAPEGNGYGMLEQWIPRIGNVYTSRRSGLNTFQGDGLVIICPTQLPSQRYRAGLVKWVREGGNLVVFDSPDLENSTANSILLLFDMASVPGAPEPEEENAPVRMADDSAHTPLAMSCAVSGETPVAFWGDTPVVARSSFGQGSVTAIGFGSLFSDAAMGYHWLPDPDEELRQRYDMLYALLRAGLQE